MEQFIDRQHAGQLLAQQLHVYSDNPQVRILALPRGGVPVGYEIASQLHIGLATFVVRKLGVPGHEELAMGALASGNARVLNHDIIDHLGIPMKMIDAVTRQEQAELERRERVYCEQQVFPNIEGCIAMLVDDGLATGSSMRAAIMALKRLKPAKIVVAIPVAPQDTYADFADLVDELVCILKPEKLGSVSRWYQDFQQVSDQTVCDLLRAIHVDV